MKTLFDRLLAGLPRNDPAASRSLTSMRDQSSPEALDRLLATLQAAVHAIAVCETDSGSTLSLNALPHPLIHYVLKGSGTLQMEGGETIAFDSHTFIVLPAKTKHSISAFGFGEQTAPTEKSIVMTDGMLRISAGASQPADVVTTCGTIEATYGGTVGLFDFVERPRAFRLGPEDALRRAFEALLEELLSPQLGSRILNDALLKQCIVLLIRRMAPDPMTAGWLFGSMDPRLAVAVLRLFDEPARTFRLDELAQASGMSRSVFAARFQSTFGTSPIDLHKRIRLHHAAGLLERTDLSVAMVARSVGYESRTYFSRAFRAEFGTDPRSFRARRRGI